jgi:signal transduction histidine kinase
VQQYEKFEAVLSSDQNGKLRHFELQSVAIYDQKRVKIGWLIMLKDISERIIAEAEIKEANVRLIAEIKEKEKLIDDLDAFSHTVAHDLKSMLSAIVTASSLLKWGIDNMTKEEQLEVNDLISQSATKTMSITRELLTLASVRQQEIVSRPVTMLNLVQEAMFRLQDIISEKETQITLTENWINVLGYESWLEEVWLNYISNAVKYGGNPPKIEIGCAELENNRVKYWITDNGNGIAPEEIETLFVKFNRLNNIRVEGHGLGLSIVKRIVDKLNGEVGVESKNITGEGSTFYFILPKAVK